MANNIDSTVKSAASVMAAMPGLVRGCPRRLSHNMVAAKAKTPPSLEDLAILADYMVDDRLFRVAVVGFPRLINFKAACAFLASTYGDALPGLTLSFRAEDGNLNCRFEAPLIGEGTAPVVPEAIVQHMVRSGFRAAGLLGAAVLRVNLTDAGLDESYARRFARRAFKRYDGILSGVGASDALAPQA